jgi:hypothetical protein
MVLTEPAWLNDLPGVKDWIDASTGADVELPRRSRARVSGAVKFSDDPAGWTNIEIGTVGSFKQPVRLATTANITLSGTQTIDGVSAVAGDRVLVKDQSTASQNGIYVVASGAWARATDFDTSAEAIPSVVIPVQEGSTLADTMWMLTTNAPITLGTTSLSFSAFGGGGGGGGGWTETGATVHLADPVDRVIAGSSTALAEAGGSVSTVSTGSTVPRGFISYQHSADAVGPLIVLRKSAGTRAALAAPSGAGTSLGDIDWQAYDGNTWETAARLRYEIDSVADGAISGGWAVYTGPASASQALSVFIRSNGSRNQIYHVDTSGTYEWRVNNVNALGLDATGLSVGVAPASAGAVRLQSGGTLQFRRNDGLGDVVGLQKNASDGVVIGSSGNPGTNGIIANVPTGATFKVIVDVNQVAQFGAEFMSIGNAPATTGSVRLETAASVFFRNAANDENLRVITTDGADAAYFGNSGALGIANAIYDVKTGGAHFWKVNAVDQMSLSDTTLDLQGNALIAGSLDVTGAFSPVTALTGASNTLAIGHANEFVTVSHGSATTLTVPPNSSVAFAIGTRIDVCAIGAGQVEIVQGAGVTVNTPATRFLRVQHSGATLVKVGTDTWQLVGDLQL